MQRSLWEHMTPRVSAVASAARANPLLAITVIALAVRQLAVCWAIAGGFRAPPNTILVVLALAVAAGAPAFAVAARRARVAALLAVDLLVGALMIAQLVYFRQFSDLPTTEHVAYATQGVEAGNALSVLLRPLDPLLCLGGSLAALVVPRLARTPPLRRRAVLACVAIGLAVFGAVLATSDMTKRARARRSSLAIRFGPIGYTLYDAGRFAALHVRRRLSVPGPAEVASDAAALAARHRAGAPAPLRGIARGMNVIVVQLESFQAFTLDARVGAEPVTPALHRLARESIRFDAFHAQVSQGNTSDAELLAQCSLYPLRTGSVFFGFSANDYRCLPEVLREAGYTTAVFHANRANFWNRERIYPAIGVERYHHAKSFQPDQPGGAVSDEAFFAQSLAVLEALPQPFQAMLITLSSHVPFDAPFVPRELDHGARAGTFVARYLDHVRYTDRALGAFVEGLRSSGLLDRSVLIVYGDHHGVGRRNSDIGAVLGLGDDDAPRWFDTERRVPLFIRVPGGPAGTVVTKTGGQLDLAPTALALLGLDVRDHAFFGQDLLDGRPGLAILPNGSAISDDR
ncbi:MAG TPA: LTA synthase family protein, partial [Anaeromyxobacteraceae bacterium]|nr:LTA synthase family protein [Anaeromyxobacteraceae bacterium]